MRFFFPIQKYLGRVFLSATCLLLQGCNNWFSSKSPEVVTNESSTVVGTSESENVTDVPEEPAKPVRATPRRPIVVEEPVFEPIPVEEPTVSPIVPDGSTTYVVRKGDTLTKIAHRFHVSVLQLMQENQLKNKNKLRVGQVLAIPQGGSSAAPPLSGEVEPYRVAKGDTLSKIAKRFQISLFELQQMNGFDRNATLSIGQMILVPKSASASFASENDDVYNVQKGDTLGKIAQKFGTTVAKLREQNHLKSDMIYVGQKLYLSGTAPVKEKSSHTSKSDAAPIEGDTYTVQAGDSLWIIAKRCRRSVAELTRLNDLKNPEQLQVGQVLRLKERSRTTERKSSYSKKSFEEPVRARSFSEPRYEEMPVERHREEEPYASKSDVSDAPKPSSTFEEDDFKDLFEENKDMPVVPLDVQ